MGDDRPAVYPEGDNWIYRASALGSCPKELTAIRCGFTPAPFPDHFTKIFADGHRGEDVIVEELRRRGFEVTRQQEEINLEVLPGVFIRGHIDGVMDTVFDAKTTSAKYGIAPALEEKYYFQLSVYAHALGFDTAKLVVAEKEKESGDVVPSSVDIRTLDTLVPLGAIKAKVAKIESYARHFFETGDYPYCDEKQYPCGAFQLHGANEDDADPYSGFAPILEDDSLDRYAQLYIEAQQAEATAKDQKANARKMILDHLGGERDQKTAEHVIAFTGSDMTTVLNKVRLERYLKSLGPGAPPLDDFYDTKSKSKSISVRPLEGSQ